MKKEQGFTLIELMVATGLFVTVVTVIISLFIQSTRAERFVARRAAAFDNIAQTVEQIAREARTGYNFPAVIDPGGRKVSELRFTNYRGESVVYRMSNNAIEKSTDGGVTFLRLTSESVKISRLDFWVMQEAIGGRDFTPRITILARADTPFQSPFNLQSTVSARLIYYRP